MFELFKKIKCENCKKMFRKSKLVNYAGIHICSEECIVEYFKGISIDDLVQLEIKDREVNKEFYRLVGGKWK